MSILRSLHDPLAGICTRLAPTHPTPEFCPKNLSVWTLDTHTQEETEMGGTHTHPPDDLVHVGWAGLSVRTYVPCAIRRCTFPYDTYVSRSGFCGPYSWGVPRFIAPTPVCLVLSPSHSRTQLEPSSCHWQNGTSVVSLGTLVL